MQVNVGCPLPVIGRSLESALSNSCVDLGSGDPGVRNRHPSARCVRGTRWFVQDLADQMSLEGIFSPVLVKVLASPERKSWSSEITKYLYHSFNKYLPVCFRACITAKWFLWSVALVMLTKSFCC